LTAQANVLVASDEQAGEGPQRSASSEGAFVAFKELKDGDVVPLSFKVHFRISGMGLAPAGSNIENTGHHHLLIDLEELPDLSGPLPANDNIRHFGKAQNETTLELSPGKHSLQLLFADYLHVPHDPPLISDRIIITVSPDAIAKSDGEQDEE
jgi:hypothetical protein